MPYTMKWEKDGVYWHYYGNLTFDDVSQSNREWYSDARFDTNTYFIVDALKVNAVDISEKDAEIPAFTDRLTNFYKPNMKGAFVATNDHILTLFEHYIETLKRLGSTWEVQIFTTINDAREWVNA